MGMFKGYTILYQEAFDFVLIEQRQLYRADLERCFSKKKFGGKTNKLTNFNFVFITSTQLSGIENMLVSFSAFQISLSLSLSLSISLSLKHTYTPFSPPQKLISSFIIETVRKSSF